VKEAQAAGLLRASSKKINFQCSMSQMHTIKEGASMQIKLYFKIEKILLCQCNQFNECKILVFSFPIPSFMIYSLL